MGKGKGKGIGNNSSKGKHNKGGNSKAKGKGIGSSSGKGKKGGRPPPEFWCEVCGAPAKLIHETQLDPPILIELCDYHAEQHYHAKHITRMLYNSLHHDDDDEAADDASKSSSGFDHYPGFDDSPSEDYAEAADVDDEAADDAIKGGDDSSISSYLPPKEKTCPPHRVMRPPAWAAALGAVPVTVGTKRPAAAAIGAVPVMVGTKKPGAAALGAVAIAVTPPRQRLVMVPPEWAANCGAQPRFVG
jgi:hypothetical protein